MPFPIRSPRITVASFSESAPEMSYGIGTPHPFSLVYAWALKMALKWYHCARGGSDGNIGHRILGSASRIRVLDGLEVLAGFWRKWWRLWPTVKNTMISTTRGTHKLGPALQLYTDDVTISSTRMDENGYLSQANEEQRPTFATSFQAHYQEPPCSYLLKIPKCFGTLVSLV